MDNSAEHLCEKARALLELSADQRIRELYNIDSRWIGYPATEVILPRMEKLLDRPTVARMRNLLLVGHTNNGKTKTLKRFAGFHPRNDNPESEGIILPVLWIQAPPVPDEGRLYDVILNTLGAPYRRKDSPSRKFHEIETVLPQIRTRMIIIDEIHNVLAGSYSAQRKFCNVIRYIGNELQISIVAAGTEEAFNVFQSDDQLANRFETYILPLWKDDDDYLSLLDSFERVLPLRYASHLSQENIATKLLSMSEGLIGEISTILNEAAELAIETKQEFIDIKLLDQIRWQLPSKRKRNV